MRNAISPRNYLTAPPYVVYISGRIILERLPLDLPIQLLDETRYTQLATLFQFLPPVVEVAREMGGMLSRLHHRASVDARDVEFVPGGDGGAGFTFFLIDFNQASAAIKYFALSLIYNVSGEAVGQASGIHRSARLSLFRKRPVLSPPPQVRHTLQSLQDRLLGCVWR